jgi:hypothetical protein
MLVQEFLAQLPPYLGMGVLAPETLHDLGTQVEVMYRWDSHDIYKVSVERSRAGERWTIQAVAGPGLAGGPSFDVAVRSFGHSVVSLANEPRGLADQLRARCPTAQVIFPPSSEDKWLTSYVPAISICTVMAITDPEKEPRPTLTGRVTGVEILPNALGRRLQATIEPAHTEVRVPSSLLELQVPAIDVSGVVIDLEHFGVSPFPIIVLGSPVVPDITVTFAVPATIGEGDVLWRLRTGPLTPTVEVRGILAGAPLAKDPSSRTGFSSIEVLPAKARAMLESAGGAVTLDPRTGAIEVAFNGLPVARVVRGQPVKTEWNEPSLGVFLTTLLAYQERAQMLQQKRGLNRGEFWERAEARDGLAIEPLLAAARAARCEIEQRGGLRAREYYVSHLAFGEIARLTVLRGTSHVADAAFASPRVYMPIQFLVTLGRS